MLAFYPAIIGQLLIPGWSRHEGWAPTLASVLVGQLRSRSAVDVCRTIKQKGKVGAMSDRSTRRDWTKPAAMAIPEGGFFKDKVEQGRYGPIFPRTPACYGFSILAKIVPGREPVFYQYAKNIEEAMAGQPDTLAVLKLHYLRWISSPSKATRTSNTWASSTQTSTNTPRMRWQFLRPSGLSTVFENLEGFPQGLEDEPLRHS